MPQQHGLNVTALEKFLVLLSQTANGRSPIFCYKDHGFGKRMEKVMPAVVNVMKEEATLVTLIKPQFEAPRSQPLCSKKKPVSLVYSLQEKLEKERESYKEMEVGRRKRITWESRMKSDELNGGLKIFHGEEENSEESHPETQTGFQRISQTHNKLQSLVDLVIWRDVSKSAFVFGIGTFIIIASSYTKDINISFKTVVSYLGLVYLAVIFLFKSIICRGVIGGDDTDQDYVVGEEEAVWLVKMILPYLNEFLLKFRALFYGDPATTM